MPHDTIAYACLGETSLALTLDGGVRDAAELMACLRLLGYSLSDAMCAARDAVHCGLVSHSI